MRFHWIRFDKHCEKNHVLWDSLIGLSNCPLFIFKRNYCDYHQDRFVDFSLVATNSEGDYVACLPATVSSNNVLTSHGGLSFGGLIFREDIQIAELLELFDSLLSFLRLQSIRELTVKPVPFYARSVQTRVDEYLWAKSGQVSAVAINTVVNYSENYKFSSVKNRYLKKAKKSGIRVKAMSSSNDWVDYWMLLSETMSLRHSLSPVHTVDEILLLHSRFPSNIDLQLALNSEEKIIAGTVLFKFNNFIHTQYLASSEEGRRCGALDLILAKLVDGLCPNQVLSFGRSDDENYPYGINMGLLDQKESFGAHSFPMYSFRVGV